LTAEAAEEEGGGQSCERGCVNRILESQIGVAGIVLVQMNVLG